MTGDDLLGLFPPGTVQDQDGMLRIGGCRLDELAAGYGTPVLVVDEQAVRQRARDYRQLLAARWPDSQVVFASKAFPCTAVQRLMVSEGLWLDVAGGGEIITALAAGADPATLVLHGNAKTTEEIELAITSGVGTVVVDNEDDIDRLAATVPPGQVQSCLVRVIPGIREFNLSRLRDRARGRQVRVVRGGGAQRDLADPCLLRGCAWTACTRTSARRSWSPTSWPLRSRRWRPWATTRSTIWAAAWAAGTPMPTSRPAWPSTWTR